MTFSRLLVMLHSLFFPICLRSKKNPKHGTHVSKLGIFYNDWQVNYYLDYRSP